MTEPNRFRLALATRNKNKVAEIAEMLRGSGVSTASLDDFGVDFEVVEDRETLEGNAEKKAVETARACRTWALADDTGLEVDALGGAPGVFSARWAGPGCTFADNCAKLLRELAGVPPERRHARFRTMIALSDPSRPDKVREGRLDGAIALGPARTRAASATTRSSCCPTGARWPSSRPTRRTRVSHRGRALRAILPARSSGDRGPRGKRCFIARCRFTGTSFAALAAADKTEPGSQTIWDDIMAQQAQRELREGGNDLCSRSSTARRSHESSTRSPPIRRIPSAI